MKIRAKHLISMFLVLMLTLSCVAIAVNASGEAEIKNIIYLIGDGMGPNHLAAYKYYRDIAQLNMESFPIGNYQNTRSFGGILTDSAAGGTALACGIRTWVNAVGVYPDYPFGKLVFPKNLRELSMEQGKKTGIVVTKPSDDATPATFSAHTSGRGNSEDINNQQLASGIDVLMGASTGYINAVNAAANGFQFVETLADMNAVSSGKLIGQYDGGKIKNGHGTQDMPSLQQMASKAINLMEDNEDGFFLMIEGSTIDSYSHSNDMEGMLEAMESFEATIAFVLDYAKQNQNTLVVITADHETGGITWDADKKEYYFTTGGHTNTDVPYFVYAPDGVTCAFNNGEVLLNTDIPKRIAKTLGWEELFPSTIATDLGVKLEDPINVLENAKDMANTKLESFFAMVPQAILSWLQKIYLQFIDVVASII